MKNQKSLINLLWIIPAIAVIMCSYFWRGYQLDDALIYLRYIKNFNNNYGLVYNPGEKFNGLTSPLFTGLMLLSSQFWSNLQALSIAISGVFLIGASYFGGKILARTFFGQLFTGISIASFGYFYTTFGMETTVLLFLMSFSVYLYKNNSDYFVLVLAMLIVTRSEGIFLAAPLFVDFCLKNKRMPNSILILVSVIVFSIPYIFNFLYYGEFLAVTGSAKIGQGKSGLWGHGWIFFNVDYLIDWIFFGKNYLAYGLIFMAIYGIFINIKNRVVVVVFIFLVLLLAFYGGLNIPNYHWYYAPFLYFAIIFSSSAVENLLCKLWSKCEWPSDRAFVGLIIFALVSVFVIQTANFKGGVRHEEYAKIGEWLKINTNAKATIAMVEIGTVGWYADRYIVDILGLTNKYNADYIAKADLYGWLSKYQPDYILRHDPRWVHEESTKFLEKNRIYEIDAKFNMAGFVLLKKNKIYTDASIAKIPEIQRQKKDILEKLISSSKTNLHGLKIEGDDIFAHAPASLTLKLDRSSEKIGFSYGLRSGSQNKHEDICFDVFDKRLNKSIFNKCIHKRSSLSDMGGSAQLDIDGQIGDEFIFKTSCRTSCDYAWSYFGDFFIDR